MNFAQRREDKRPEQKQTIRRFVLMQREYHRAMRIWTVPVLLRIVFILIDMRADFPSPHREKLGAQKKLVPLSPSRLNVRERKKYRKSRTFPLTREQRCARISLKRTSTSSNDHLPKSFTSCVASSAILFVFILCALLWMKLFLGFSSSQKGAKNNQNFLWDFRLPEDFWQKNRSKHKCWTFLIFSLWFWVGALVKFVLLWLWVLPLYYHKGIIICSLGERVRERERVRESWRESVEEFYASKEDLKNHRRT